MTKCFCNKCEKLLVDGKRRIQVTTSKPIENVSLELCNECYEKFITDYHIKEELDRRIAERERRKAARLEKSKND